MRKEEQLYLEIGRKLQNAEESQMFGKPCFKVNGKAFMSLFNNSVVFKLHGDTHQDALSLDGSQLFDPSDRGRPMKEWILVPYHYATKWPLYAKAALEYVSSLTR